MGYEDNNDIKNDYLQDWNDNIVSKIDNNDGIERINEYVLHTARIIDYPDLNVANYLAQIDKMGKEFNAKIKSPKTMRPTLIIEKLNEFFFDQQEFKPNINDYYNPVNNCLNIVLEKRTGIPITLSLVYIHLASYLDFKLYPVNFPSHFLVKYILDENTNESIVIDPFNKGRIMDDYILQDLLKNAYPSLEISVSKDLLKKAMPRQIIIRILNNFKNGYSEVDDLNKIMKINEMIISLDNSNPEAIRDRGIILYRFKNYEEALKNLYQYIELNPEASDMDNILELVKQIRDSILKG
ncbi:MAG TPA: transglutaminase-like domain-containing protein [Candidatus Nitrosocosmicus sp.]|nr:transglutaminase-like domain-containing protein [Candidatus Nitrosocosmicus sp.]